MNGVKLDDLKVYTDELKKHKPGDKVDFRVIRGEKSMQIPVFLEAR